MILRFEIKFLYVNLTQNKDLNFKTHKLLHSINLKFMIVLKLTIYNFQCLSIGRFIQHILLLSLNFNFWNAYFELLYLVVLCERKFCIITLLSIVFVYTTVRCIYVLVCLTHEFFDCRTFLCVWLWRTPWKCVVHVQEENGYRKISGTDMTWN